MGRMYFDGDLLFAEAVADPPSAGAGNADPPKQTTPEATPPPQEDAANSDTRNEWDQGAEPDAKDNGSKDASSIGGEGDNEKAEVYSKATLDATAEAARQEERERIAKEQRERDAQLQKASRERSLRSHVPSMLASVREALNEAEASTEFTNKIVGLIEGGAGQFKDWAEINATDTLRGAYADILGSDEAVDAIYEANTDDEGRVDVVGVQQAIIEARAPESAALKAMTLEDFLKVNAKARAAHGKALDEAKEEGRSIGRGDPQADRGGGGNGASSNGNWKTKAEARALHTAGKLTHAEMRAIRDDPTIPEGL